MAEHISITGMGIICAIGNDKQSVCRSLQTGCSGIGEMKYLESMHKELPVGEVKMSDAQMKQLLGIEEGRTIGRTSMMGAIAIREALAQAGIDELKGKKVALISGTTVGVMDITEKYIERMKNDPSLNFLPHSNECGRSTVEMAELCGLENARICTISTACSSALNSIMLGAEMLKRGDADIVIAGGSEALSKFHLNGFNTLMILDSERCRPFDASRRGLNLGEGAAFVVLEKNAENALAYVAGYGNRCDAFHQTASSENGEGAFLSMNEALESSGVKASEIDYVNAHGTGTPNNDISEGKALKRVFGEHLPPVSSTKSFTGHTTSASGSIETVISILAMQNDFIPANLGWSSSDEGGIEPTLGQSGVKLSNILCNSFGFGGNDSSMVISSAAKDCELTGYGKEHSSVAAQCHLTHMDDLSALREFISPMESRRMGQLMKASHLAALRTLADAGIKTPGAIIAATSYGMLKISEQFLDDIISQGEQTLKPTLFMQSTHNTIGSAIAIRTGCHGYNITYSQGDDSEKWALYDATRLIEDAHTDSVLVISFDEEHGSDEFKVDCYLIVRK